MLNEVVAAQGGMILFIDEMHTLVCAGQGRWRDGRLQFAEARVVSASFRQGMTMLSSTGSAMAKIYPNAGGLASLRLGLIQLRPLLAGRAPHGFWTCSRHQASSVPLAKDRIGTEDTISIPCWAAHSSKGTGDTFGQTLYLTTIHLTSGGNKTD